MGMKMCGRTLYVYEKRVAVDGGWGVELGGL